MIGCNYEGKDHEGSAVITHYILFKKGLTLNSNQSVRAVLKCVNS